MSHGHKEGRCTICGGSTWDKSAIRCRRCYHEILRKKIGPANREWDHFTSTKKSQGWDRSKRRKKLGLCEHCGKAPAIDRHHINNNPKDNRSENVLGLCRRCHMELDGRLQKLAARFRHK